MKFVHQWLLPYHYVMRGRSTPNAHYPVGTVFWRCSCGKVWL